MACSWYNCRTPTPDGKSWCTLHGKQMGIERPVKEKKAIPKVSAKKKSNQPKEKADKQNLTAFYNEMLAHAPLLCMETGEPLIGSTVINSRTICVHILSKSGFPSVATNPLNIIYLTAYEHSKFDLQTERYLKEAKISGLIKQRVSLLIPFLSTEEVNKIPAYLL